MTRKERALAAVAPTEASARRAVGLLGDRVKEVLLPFSLARYRRCPEAPATVVLCPPDQSIARGLAFLLEASERLLWPAPDEVLTGAIDGLLGTSAGERISRRRIRGRRRSEAASRTALLLEGIVTSARARALDSQDVRRWIVESPRHVRVEHRVMRHLAQSGVVWYSLQPVTVAAIFASSSLLRARSHWSRLLPQRTRVWIRTDRAARKGE